VQREADPAAAHHTAIHIHSEIHRGLAPTGCVSPAASSHVTMSPPPPPRPLQSENNTPPCFTGRIRIPAAPCVTHPKAPRALKFQYPNELKHPVS